MILKNTCNHILKFYCFLDTEFGTVNKSTPNNSFRDRRECVFLNIKNINYIMINIIGCLLKNRSLDCWKFAYKLHIVMKNPLIMDIRQPESMKYIQS